MKEINNETNLYSLRKLYSNYYLDLKSTAYTSLNDDDKTRVNIYYKSILDSDDITITKSYFYTLFKSGLLKLITND